MTDEEIFAAVIVFIVIVVLIAITYAVNSLTWVQEGTVCVRFSPEFYSKPEVLQPGARIIPRDYDVIVSTLPVGVAVPYPRSESIGMIALFAVDLERMTTYLEQLNPRHGPHPKGVDERALRREESSALKQQVIEACTNELALTPKPSLHRVEEHFGIKFRDVDYFAADDPAMKDERARNERVIDAVISNVLITIKGVGHLRRERALFAFRSHPLQEQNDLLKTDDAVQQITKLIDRAIDRAEHV